ncbi:hypothetical protein AB0G74_32795 [Streptomyces sp. NPDC020875]|uniref:effector-associated constant component EACC1 n=1 Tax=Streptomyces sp. NPDC020875 TaxID=3154898 RepID=UPI0033CFA2CC
MRVSVTVDDGHGGAGNPLELFRWLSMDPDLKTTARLTLRPAPPGPGEMGGAFEIVSAVLGHTLALSGLVVAVANWRATRGGDRAPGVRIERGGVVVEVRDGSPETVERITRALTAGAGGGEPDPAPGDDTPAAPGASGAPDTPEAPDPSDGADGRPDRP